MENTSQSKPQPQAAELKGPTLCIGDLIAERLPPNRWVITTPGDKVELAWGMAQQDEAGNWDRPNDEDFQQAYRTWQIAGESTDHMESACRAINNLHIPGHRTLGHFLWSSTDPQAGMIDRIAQVRVLERDIVMTVMRAWLTGGKGLEIISFGVVEYTADRSWGLAQRIMRAMDHCPSFVVAASALWRVLAGVHARQVAETGDPAPAAAVGMMTTAGAAAEKAVSLVEEWRKLHPQRSTQHEAGNEVASVLDHMPGDQPQPGKPMQPDRQVAELLTPLGMTWEFPGYWGGLGFVLGAGPDGNMPVTTHTEHVEVLSAAGPEGQQQKVLFTGSFSEVLSFLTYEWARKLAAPRTPPTPNRTTFGKDKEAIEWDDETGSKG